MLAETARFELAVRVTPYDSLANCWFQPLTHVSGFAAKRGYSWGVGEDQLGTANLLKHLIVRFGAYSTQAVAWVIAAGTDQDSRLPQRKL